MSVKLTCPKHPRYNAKISPRANCDECLAIYTMALNAAALRIKVS